MNLIDFSPQQLVLCHLAHQKPFGQIGFCGDAFRSENIGIAPLVLSGGEIPQLEQSLVQECVEHVMDAARTDANDFGQLVLAHFGVVLQKVQDPELHIFAQLVALCGYD